MQDILNIIGEWLKAPGGIITIGTIAATIIIRIISKIHNEAIKTAGNLVSKDELLKRENALMARVDDMELKIRDECKQDMQVMYDAYIQQMNKLRDEIKENQNIDKVIDEKIKLLNDKFQALTRVEAKIIHLERRFNAYDDRNFDGDPMRRTDI